MDKRKNDKLIHLDLHFARLLHALHLAFGGGHSRCAQFALDYAHGVQSHLKAFRSQRMANESMHVFIPFRVGALIDQRAKAEAYARDNYMSFAHLLRHSINEVLEDLQSGNLTSDHRLVRKYFPGNKVIVPLRYLDIVENEIYDER